jgi:hypothetical protein
MSAGDQQRQQDEIDAICSIYPGEGEFELLEPAKFALRLPLDSATLLGESANLLFTLPVDYPSASPPVVELRIAGFSDEVNLSLANELASLASNQYLHSECILELCADVVELVANHLEHEASNGPMMRLPDRALFFVYLYIHSLGLPNLARCCHHLRASFHHSADRLSTAHERLCATKMKRSFGASCAWSWLLYHNYLLSSWFLRESLLDVKRGVFPPLNIVCVLIQQKGALSIPACSAQTSLAPAKEDKIFVRQLTRQEYMDKYRGIAVSGSKNASKGEGKSKSGGKSWLELLDVRHSSIQALEELFVRTVAAEMCTKRGHDWTKIMQVATLDQRSNCTVVCVLRLCDGGAVVANDMGCAADVLDTDLERTVCDWARISLAVALCRRAVTMKAAVQSLRGAHCRGRAHGVGAAASLLRQMKACQINIERGHAVHMPLFRNPNPSNTTIDSAAEAGAAVAGGAGGAAGAGDEYNIILNAAFGYARDGASTDRWVTPMGRQHAFGRAAMLQVSSRRTSALEKAWLEQRHSLPLRSSFAASFVLEFGDARGSGDGNDGAHGSSCRGEGKGKRISADLPRQIDMGARKRLGWKWVQCGGAGVLQFLQRIAFTRFAGSKEDHSIARLVGHRDEVRTHPGFWQELVKQFVMTTSGWGDDSSIGSGEGASIGSGGGAVNSATWLYGYQTEAGLAQAQLDTSAKCQGVTAAAPPQIHYDYRYLDPFAVVVLDGALDTVAQCVVGNMVLGGNKFDQ